MEPIAVIGIGCRLPGDIRSGSDLWKLLMSKGMASTAKVPKNRFNMDAYLYPGNDRPGSFNVPGGYFIEDEPDKFDPGMFNISPVEAHCMDPQQRKLLETVYEAFESSGTTLDKAAGSKMGCFVGCFTWDYAAMTVREPDFRQTYVCTGPDPGILGNRVSYVFDLKGPSLTVNTACSSSLYALNLACKSLLSGECESAVVGGTNLILTVDQQMNTGRLSVLSPTNQCHTFDESADGYSRSEGVGALHLKPLSAAIRDGDPVRAVIRSTAATSNGKHKDGLTHPSVEGQVEIISFAHEKANLPLKDTTYIECHGTGTPVGDPIEVKAIQKALGADPERTNPILIGSVKPNIGHSEAASSMSTLIKTILGLENGIIPPTAGITKLATNIPWDDINVKVVREPTPFPASMPVKRIGVSAFGFGGTNAHAVLESADSVAPGYRAHKFMHHAEGVPNGTAHSDPDADRPHLLLFSAHDGPTLKNNIANYSTHVHEADLIDLAYTLGLRRTKFPCRAVAVGRKETLERDIQAASTDTISAPNVPAKPAFVFTGQGAQWPQMGKCLLQAFPSVLKTIRALDEHLATLQNPPSWKIEDALNEPDESSLVNEPEYSQPLCTAVQIALVNLLARWGTRPKATVGHSSGEIGAAYAAGLISAESAITAGYFRGKVAASLRTDGAMLAVGVGADDAHKYIEDASYQAKVVVACHNSPTSTTLSGDREAIEDLKTILDKKSVFARVLKTGGKAYHSHHMKAAADKYLNYLRMESITTVSEFAKVPMFSTVRTEQIGVDTQSVPDTYWVDNLRSPVLFRQGVELMLTAKPEINMLIEVGPHAALAGPLRQICQTVGKANTAYLSTLKRKENDADQMLRLAGGLWARDAPVDIATVTGVETISKTGEIGTRTGTLLVDLPTYKWTYSKSYWSECRESRELRNVKEPRHDILGRRVAGTSVLEPVWRNILRQKDLPWVSQHQLGGEAILPGAGYLALAMEAITQVNSESEKPLEIESYTIRDVVISSATVVPDDDSGTETIFTIAPMDGDLEISRDGVTSQWFQFVASCCAYGSWKETARGKISLNTKGRGSSHKPEKLPPTPIRTPHIDYLDKLRTVGFDFGPAFHHMSDIYSDGQTHTIRGDMGISKECGLMLQESRYVLHPAVLDSCLQSLAATLCKGKLDDLRCATIPTHFREATIFPPSPAQLAERCTVQVWSPEIGTRALHSNLQLIAHDGSLLVDVKGCRNLLYAAAVPQDMRGCLQRDLYVKLDWKVDAEYLPLAQGAGLLSEQPLVVAVDAYLHKDASTRALCFDEGLVEPLLRAQPTLAMTIAVSTKEEKDVVAVKYADNEDLNVIHFDIKDPKGSGSDGLYDLVIAPETDDLEAVRSVVSTKGRVLMRTNATEESLKTAGFSGIEHTLPDGTVVTTAVEEEEEEASTTDSEQASDDKKVLLVYRAEPASLLSKVSQLLTASGFSVRSESVSTLSPVSGEQVVLLADAEGPFLAQLDEPQLKGLISLTEKAAGMTWVTCGGLLTGDKPEYGMTAGLARVVRQEKGALDLVTIDTDEATSDDAAAKLVCAVVARQHAQGRNGETEYCIQDGVPHVGRLVPHKALNREFVPDSGETTLLHQKDKPAVRAELKDGALAFRRDVEKETKPLARDEVEVHVAALGLGDADGSDDSPFLSREFAGTVTRVGRDVFDVTVGMRVLGVGLGQLHTFQRTRAGLVQPVPSFMSLAEAATLPAAFAAAMYGLERLARVEKGETVAVVDGLGPVGLAAVQLCRLHGARPVVVTSSEDTRRYLVNSGLLQPDQIVAKNEGCLSDMVRRAAAAGKGVDVLFSSSQEDETTMLECTQALAPFGRVVAVVGPAGDWEFGGLATDSRVKGLSTFSFGLEDLIEGRPKVLSSILERCANLCNDGYIQPLPSTVTNKTNEIYNVIHSITNDLGVPKQVISYDEGTWFKALPARAPLQFKADATYLLVGCLGGLGRQVALWMASRGAKHLAFVSRSGADSPAAAKVLSTLQQRGVDAVALRADITDRGSLAAAVGSLDRRRFPIRGAVNAATVIQDSIFANMTMAKWRAVADTKVRGSLNLHAVLGDLAAPLDFFVMTSSIASALGSAGQGNYSAANALLDALATHRRARGQPAMSLVLPAIFGIGHIAEHREIEAAIRSKGYYGVYEAEMLDAFEVAMTPDLGQGVAGDHVVLGVQPRRFGAAIRAAGAHVGFDTDPRLGWLARAVAQQGGGGSGSGGGAAESILTTIAAAPSPDEAVAAATAHMARRLGRVLMLEEADVAVAGKSIASHGLDSMIGAEFRNWLFREFGADIPFQQLLAGSLTLTELAKTLCARVREGKA
ncbi:putative polyketide synthase [Xylariomycetidae sp. FL0641]|nr:putative polyketide synthase [Xylariomycetidae sp. FL0641]